MNAHVPHISQTPLIAGLIGGVFALIGLLPMPMPFYNTMRIVVAVACVTIAIGAVGRKKLLAIVPLAILAIFFLFVKGLSKGQWMMIDFVAAVCVIGLGAWLSRKPICE